MGVERFLPMVCRAGGGGVHAPYNLGPGGHRGAELGGWPVGSEEGDGLYNKRGEVGVVSEDYFLDFACCVGYQYYGE